jgi:hypothetical protein
MYREFQKAVKTWDFVNHIDCDFYISTFDYTDNVYQVRYKRFTIEDRKIPVTKEMIIDYLPNANVIISNDNLGYVTYKEEDMRIRNNARRKYFHWKNCLKICNQSNVQYDIIILLRLYLKVKLKIPYNEFNVTDDSLYSTSEIIDNRIIDLLFYGKYNTISKMIDNIPDDTIMDPHTDFVRYLIDMDINIKKINGIIHDVIRCNDPINVNEVVKYLL